MLMTLGEDLLTTRFNSRAQMTPGEDLLTTKPNSQRQIPGELLTLCRTIMTLGEEEVLLNRELSLKQWFSPPRIPGEGPFPTPRLNKTTNGAALKQFRALKTPGVVVVNKRKFYPSLTMKL